MPIHRTRIIVDFALDEYNALMALCEMDLRLPSDEIRYLVAEKARQRGLLPKIAEEFVQAQQPVAA